MNAQTWQRFSKAPKAEDAQTVLDRLSFLADVLPRYCKTGDLSGELSDLDLDLGTFLSCSSRPLTPWLIHSDWFSDLEAGSMPAGAEILIHRALGLAKASGELDIPEALKIIDESLQFIDRSSDEAGVIAVLTTVDFLAHEIIAAIIRGRLVNMVK